MVTFLKQVVNFLLLSTLLLSFIILVPPYFINKKANFKLDKNDEMIVVGHSHPECAYNDSLIPSLKNLANSGESYFYTLQKLKKIVPANPQIKTIFIEFSNSQIEDVMDQWIWGYDKMSHYLPLYEPFMNKEDLTLLFSQNPKDFMSCLSIASKKNLFRTMVLDLNYVEKIGGYERLEKSISKKLIEETQIQSLSFNKNIKISENHLLYLRKIIDFCRQYGKVVYLIRSPQHKSLPELANESQFQNILNIRFNDVEFLDFNAFSLPNEYFADLEHLNYKGAEEYSIWFANLLRNGLLNSKNKKLLIKERN